MAHHEDHDVAWTDARWTTPEDHARQVGRSLEVRTLSDSNVGAVYVQPVVNTLIQDISNSVPGAWVALDHKPGTGRTSNQMRRTPGTTGAQWVPDTGTVNREEGSWTQPTFQFRTCASRGRITRRTLREGASYGDLLGSEAAGKTRDMVQGGTAAGTGIEGAIFIGDNAADANQPSGLLTLAMAVAGQVVANTTAVGGDAVTLNRLDAAIDQVRGGRLAIFANRAARRSLDASLQAQQQFVDSTEIRGGFRVATYRDVPIVTTTGLPNTMVWNGTNRVTAFTGGATTAILVVNLDETYIEELTPLQMMMLSVVDSQYREFDIFSDLVFVQANTLGISVLGGVLGS